MSLRRLPAVALLLAAVPGLSAQSQKLAAEVEFIRGLVTELKFVDLAESEVGLLRKTYKDSEDFKLVTQLGIEVSLQGAKRHPDRAQRRELYKSAIDKSAQFIESCGSGQAVAEDARVTLADACIEFGAFLNEELEIARDEAPDRVKGLEEEAAAVFRQGAEASTQSERYYGAQEKETEKFVSQMRRGILLREHARAVPADRGHLCDMANEVFEELILEVGEETILGQRALFEMSKIQEVKGDLEQAISRYKDAIAAIYEALTDSEFVLPEAAQRLMFYMMQEIYDRLATVSLRQGDTDQVLAAVEEFRKRVKEFRTEADPNFGDSLYLSEAQVKAGSGSQAEVSEALKTAKAINANHPNDYVGLKAKNLIRDILAQSADLVTGELLLEVARGDFQEKEYEAAIAGFKRALNGMDGDAKKRLGFETWTLIGRSNQSMQRNLEAAMAFSRGIDEHAGEMVDDPDGKDKLKQAANQASRCIRRAMADADDAAIFKTLSDKIEDQLRQYDVAVADAGDYANGLRAKNDNKLDEAVALFTAVKPTYTKYELALGHAIECLFRLEKYDETRARIAEFRKYVAETEIPENEHERRGYRPQAVAWVHYTEGRILYEEARGKDGKPDLTKFKDVVRHFLEFEQVHAEFAGNLMPKVHEVLGHAYLETGEEAKAAERYNQLKTLGATLPDAHKALGILMFTAFRDQVSTLETEFKSYAKAGNKPPADAAARLRRAREKALDVAMDYAKTIGRPQYGLLYNGMRLAEDLEDWPKVETCAESILKLYGDGKESSLRQVKPLLGYALLRQPGRMQEALDVLAQAEQELGEGKKTSAYYDVLRYKALALGGWPAFDKDGINYEPNPGMGKPAEAYELYWGNEHRKFALHSRRAPKFSLAWSRFHLEVYYFARRAQPTDSKFQTRADTLFNIARSTDEFASLRAHGPDGERMANLFMQIR